jgi:hypothetical protein
VPLNFTVLVPCVAPKFAPAIVTELPTTPDAGLTLVMLGAGGGFPPPPGLDVPAPLQPMAAANAHTNQERTNCRRVSDTN